MTQRIYSPENISGPRERLVPVDCTICRGISEIACPECSDAVCRECLVECAHCRDQEAMCLQCASKRGGLQTIEGEWLCENCAGAMESELELVRR